MSLCLCEVAACIWFVVTLPTVGWVPLKHWCIGLMFIDSGKWNFKERNLSPIHHKCHTNCSGIEAGSPQWHAGDWPPPGQQVVYICRLNSVSFDDKSDVACRHVKCCPWGVWSAYVWEVWSAVLMGAWSDVLMGCVKWSGNGVVKWRVYGSVKYRVNGVYIVTCLCSCEVTYLCGVWSIVFKGVWSYVLVVCVKGRACWRVKWRV